MGGKEASKVSFGDYGARHIRYNEHQQTKTQLEGLRGEIAGKLKNLGITDPSLVDEIIAHPMLMYIILANREQIKFKVIKKDENKGEIIYEAQLPKDNTIIKKIVKGGQTKYIVKIGNNKPVELSARLGNILLLQPSKKLKSLQNLIEQRLSFKLDGERVWIYQVTTGKETETEEKEKVWRFRIPPGLRKSNPDLARFFDLSNKFNIDARSWIENPEEAAKQFNDEVRKRLFKKTEKKPDLVLHFAEMFKDIKSDKFQPKNYERELTFIRVFSEFDNAGKSKHKDYVRTYVLIPLATGEATGTQLLKRAKGDLKTLLGLKDEDINKMGKTELLIMWGIVRGRYYSILS